MIVLVVVIFVVIVATEFIKCKVDPVATASMRFDWDSYRADMDKMSVEEQMKKIDKGRYWTEAPLQKEFYPAKDVVDTKRYRRDLEMYGEEFAERRRKTGTYDYIRNF